jgi:hypothetical protein
LEVADLVLVNVEVAVDAGFVEAAALEARARVAVRRRLLVKLLLKK